MDLYGARNIIIKVDESNESNTGVLRYILKQNTRKQIISIINESFLLKSSNED